MEELALAFKALSDPLRLKLLKLLTKQNQCKEFCVCGLAEELDISQPNMSHHLKVLKSAGLIRCDKCDGCSYYVVDWKRVGHLFQRLNQEIREDDRTSEL